MTTAIGPAQGEHRLFDYSPLPSHPELIWPGKARLALPIVVHFECMDFDAAPDAVRDPRWRERIQPDPRHYSWYEYGNRVAIFRILDSLDRLGLTATIAANALACERYPYLVERFLKRGYEFAAHGHAANGMISSALSLDQERDAVGEAIRRIETSTNARVAGWIAQDFGESTHTPQVLRDAGLTYVADWPNDDQPYLMTGAGGLVSIPAAFEWDDMRLFMERRMQAWRYPEIVGDAFRRLYAEGETHPGVLPISIHPWVFGAPHRVRYLEETLKAIVSQGSVWNATTGQIANCFLDQQ